MHVIYVCVSLLWANGLVCANKGFPGKKKSELSPSFKLALN